MLWEEDAPGAPARSLATAKLFAQESMEIFHIKTSPVATLKFMAAPEKSLSL
jgi:hypothetical protein